MMVQMWELSQNDRPSAKCLVSGKMFNVYFYVYPMSIFNTFGIENVFTFVLNFFFCIWIGNESEYRVPANLVQIRQSGRVGYGAAIRIL